MIWTSAVSRIKTQISHCETLATESSETSAEDRRGQHKGPRGGRSPTKGERIVLAEDGCGHSYQGRKGILTGKGTTISTKEENAIITDERANPS
jgi:hypothetical protein